jgi:hypothetical protein
MPLGPIHNSGSGGSSAWGDITGTLTDQTDLKNVLADKAPLASPLLTGTPRAPDPSTGDNPLQIATKGFVEAAIWPGAIVINSGTTKELSSDDKHKIQICTNAAGCTISGIDASGLFDVGAELLFQQAGGPITFEVPFGCVIYAPDGLVSPKKYAVMSLRQVTSSGWILTSYGYALAGAPTVTVEDSSSTLALTDIGKWLRFTSADAVEVTIPAQSDVTWPADVEIFVEQAGEGTVTIVGDTGVTLNGEVNTAGQFAALALKRIAEDEWTVIGGVE